jgi:prepilin-type processing-associated H-X9-DG protein
MTTANSNAAIGDGDGYNKVSGGKLIWAGPTRFLMIKDGLSNTLLVGEKHIKVGLWGIKSNGDSSVYSSNNVSVSSRKIGPGFPLQPPTGSTTQNAFGSYHPDLCQFVFCDGHVQALSIATSVDLLRRLAAREDGETLPEGF